MIYLDLAALSFLSLAVLRMLRDYYLIKWRGNGRYFVFFIINVMVASFYSISYEISCGKGAPCPGEVTVGETFIALFPAFVHLVAGIDALKATR